MMYLIKLKTLILQIGFYVVWFAPQNLTAQSWESNFHYFQNTPTYNPAYVGIYNAPTLNLNYHHYNSNSNPFSNLIDAGFHTQLSTKPIGIGLSYKRDKFDLGKMSGYLAQFAYHFQLQEKINLSAGIQLGIKNYFIDLSSLFFQTTNEPNIINDQFINADIGALLYSEIYYIGISLGNIINQKVNKQSPFKVDSPYSLYVSGGIVFKAHPQIDIRPSILMNLNFNEIDTIRKYSGFLDISVDALFFKTLWLGATFRPKTPLKIQAKVDIKQRVSMFAYWQIIKNNRYTEKRYFFGLGLQAYLSKIEKKSPPIYF